MFSIYSAGFSECSLAPSSPGERLADLWVLPWLLEAIRDTGLGGPLARLRDLQLAASRCRLAVTRLLLLQTAEAWSHHTLSSSCQAQYCSCLPALSQLSGTRTPADSSGVLISRDCCCTAQWSQNSRAGRLGAAHTGGLLCSLMSPGASVRSLPHFALPSPQKARPGKAAAFFRGPHFLTTAHYQRHCLF